MVVGIGNADAGSTGSRTLPIELNSEPVGVVSLNRCRL